MSIVLPSHEKGPLRRNGRWDPLGAGDEQNAHKAFAFTTPRSMLTVAFAHCFLVLCFFSVPAWADDYFQYLPSPLEAETSPAREDGILVKKITIRRGDTLSTLSRHYAGRGYYYPQILLFNKISNPNRIFAGRELLVPVSSPASRRKGAQATSAMPRGPVFRDAVQPPSGTKSRTKEKLPSADEIRLFKKAVAMLNRGDYRQALDGFSLFLKRYPDSTLSPDAHLYRADCYLRLSGRQESEPVP